MFPSRGARVAKGTFNQAAASSFCIFLRKGRRCDGQMPHLFVGNNDYCTESHSFLGRPRFFVPGVSVAEVEGVPCVTVDCTFVGVSAEAVMAPTDLPLASPITGTADESHC